MKMQARETRAQKILAQAAANPALAELALESVRDGRSFSDFLKDGLNFLAEQKATPGLAVGRTWDEKWRSTASDFLVWRAVGRIPGRMHESERSRREAAASDFGVQEINERDGVLDSIARRLNRGPSPAAELQIRALQMTNSDFPGVALDAANKSLYGFFQEFPQNWRPLCRIRNAPDFKVLNSIGFQGAAAYVLTPDGIPASEGSAVDVRNQYQLQTYTKSYGLSRRMLIDDNLEAFGTKAAEAARGAATTIADLVFNLLISASGVGPTMAEDTLPLFATTHASGPNYIAAVGAPDAAGIAALSRLMRLQKGLVAPGETAPFIGIRPAILLAPAALGEQARATLAAASSIEVDGDSAFEKSPRLVVEPRLDGGTNGTVAWYLIADPIQVPGLEIAGLDGRVQPSLRVSESVSPLGLQFTATLDIGVKWVEYRGWARTRGA